MTEAAVAARVDSDIYDLVILVILDIVMDSITWYG